MVFDPQIQMQFQLFFCMLLTEFTISSKATFWSLMSRTWVWLLGD